jgi:hypothetical protein
VATSRFARWAYSTKNIVGVGLAVVGPALGLAGVVNPILGAALAPALYIVGALAAPSRKRVDLAGSIDPSDALHSLEAIQRRIKRRVPDDVATRVQHIAASITDSLARAKALGEGSEDLFGLVKTATDYLPTALQAYLDLPRAYADRKVVADRKTAKDILCEQLDLLAKKMDEIADDVNRADTDKLIAHGRFLAEKFGKGNGDLQIQ